jgi:2-polyprenyl-3-methyl-5-hydroxy-6-metoxy-1,4-benzoquinol methylase
MAPDNHAASQMSQTLCDGRDRQEEQLAYTQNSSGIFQPSLTVAHRDEEYDQRGFEVLCEMQERHFWYRGRHRFLLHATKQVLRRWKPSADCLSVIDVGGGCGGWVKYLVNRKPRAIAEMALADSSLLALEKAGTLLPSTVFRYQVDIMNLGWKQRWDMVYLLDVLEHLPDDESAMRQVAAAIKQDGLVLVTMPALQFFWSYNDEVAEHQRRYDRNGMARLAKAAGLRLLTARYFMFFLSPLLWLSRTRPGLTKLTAEQKHHLLRRAHRIPPLPVNETLAAVFCAETPLGHCIQFPWGTSILGVFQKT